MNLLSLLSCFLLLVGVYGCQDGSGSIDTSNPNVEESINLWPAIIWSSLFILASQILSQNEEIDIEFIDVTLEAGIDHLGPSYGSAWGDVNGDGYPDIFETNHEYDPSFYLNNGDGTFSDLSDEWWHFETGMGRDTHGCAWGDIDNDGNQELLEMVGSEMGEGESPNNIYKYVDGRLRNMGQELGLLYEKGRGRTPLWFDYDLDGHLDVLLVNRERQDAPSSLYHQEKGLFREASDVLTLDPQEGWNFAQLSKCRSETQSMDLMLWDTKMLRIFDISTIPFTEIPHKKGIPDLYCVQDVAIADLNGDLKPDIYLGLNQNFVSDVRRTCDEEISVGLVCEGESKGISFRGGSIVIWDLYSGHMLDPEDIFIGSNGWHPEDTKFSLNENDTSTHGLYVDPYESLGNGIYIGFNDVSERWEFFLSVGEWVHIEAIISSDQSIQNVHAVNFIPTINGAFEDIILFQTDSGWKPIWGPLSIPTVGVVAGDFDNDMDVDLYLICQNTLGNHPNILLSNRGNADFFSIPDAGGAAGSAEGRGDNAIVADYDEDGFLDIFLTNGFRRYPFVGPQQLFRNQGNENHWLEIDLIGTRSNRDAIGSWVIATTDGISQLREQGGGMHAFHQNHQRIHFGLGPYEQVDELLIHWPNGEEQIIYDIPVDQILQIIEPQSSPGSLRPDYLERTK